MISCVNGTILVLRPGFCVLSAGGVGYKIAAPKDVLSTLEKGAETFLWTYLAVREDSLDLYGFLEENDLTFFELLMTVPSVGPKSALSILNAVPADILRSAIASGNDGYLTNVSGIGKKTAQKILFELKDKIGAPGERAAAQLERDEEALEAMSSLGYTLHEARDALKKVPETITGSSARLREALRLLGGA